MEFGQLFRHDGQRYYGGKTVYRGEVAQI